MTRIGIISLALAALLSVPGLALAGPDGGCGSCCGTCQGKGGDCQETKDCCPDGCEDIVACLEGARGNLAAMLKKEQELPEQELAAVRAAKSFLVGETSLGRAMVPTLAASAAQLRAAHRLDVEQAGGAAAEVLAGLAATLDDVAAALALPSPAEASDVRAATDLLEKAAADAEKGLDAATSARVNSSNDLWVAKSPVGKGVARAMKAVEMGFKALEAMETEKLPARDEAVAKASTLICRMEEVAETYMGAAKKPAETAAVPLEPAAPAPSS